MADASVVVLQEGVVVELQVNRPQSLNALNLDVLNSLGQIFDRLTFPGTRAVILTGAGEKAFVAGADVASMASYGPGGIADYIERGQRLMRQIERLPYPVIAAVNGFALGGGLELALACDLIVASNTAKIGQPEVNLGIIPGFGGTQRLIDRVGTGTTRRLCYTGELIGAEEAQRLGVIDIVVEPAVLMQRCRDIAASISSKGPLAVGKCKEVINRSIDGRLAAGLRAEVEGFLSLFDSKDRAEGMEAFLQKRPAKFVGK